MRSRIMYIEEKSGGITGPARIGRVFFSKSGRTLRYGNREFTSLKGAGLKSNYVDVATGEEFWISGPKRDGTDRLYGSAALTEIDEDVREEYWTTIRRRNPGSILSPNAHHAGPRRTQDASQNASPGRRLRLVAHTDRGPQHTSADDGQVLDDHHVLASVSSVGDAYNNALAESFLDTFKTELITDRA